MPFFAGLALWLKQLFVSHHTSPICCIFHLPGTEAYIPHSDRHRLIRSAQLLQSIDILHPFDSHLTAYSVFFEGLRSQGSDRISNYSKDYPCCHNKCVSNANIRFSRGHFKRIMTYWSIYNVYLFSDPGVELINLQPACIPCLPLECTPFLNYRKMSFTMKRVTKILIIQIVCMKEFLQKLDSLSHLRLPNL